MKLFRFCVFIAACICLQNTAIAQMSKADSIKSSFKHSSTPDTIEYYKALTNAYFGAGLYDSGKVYGYKLVDFHKKKKDLNKAYTTQLRLCQVLSGLGKKEDCLACIEKAEEYYKNTTDYAATSKINAMRGDYYLNQVKDMDKGAAYFNKNIQLHHSGKTLDAWALQFSFQSLSVIYTIQKKYTEALKINQENLKYNEKNAPEQKANTLLALGFLYKEVKEYSKSLKAIREATYIYEQSDQKYQLGDVYRQLGEAFDNTGQVDSTYFYYYKAIASFKKDGDNNSAANLLNFLATVKEKDGKLAEAQQLSEEAMRLVDKSSVTYQVFQHRRLFNQLNQRLINSEGKNLSPQEQAELLKILRETEEANEHWKKVYPGYEETNYISIYQLLGQGFMKAGRAEEAVPYLTKSLALKDSLYNTDKLKEFSELEASINLEKERSKILFEEATKRLKIEKEMELASLRHEYDRKQAAAKTEKERQQLIHEEELKRKEIEVKYAEEQKAIALKFEQEKKIVQIEQEKKDAIARAELQSAHNVRNLSALGVGLATLLLGITGWSYFQKRKDNKRIAEEKQKSEDLLLNILPQEVAEELKEKGTTSAQLHDEVSVLFTDFVNFTANAEKIGVKELIEELNECFTAFDQIMERHGLEKIKTIGDAYLAVSGLPASNPQHARNAVLAAKDILDFVVNRRTHKSNALDIRIGINSGAVVAGIVGVKKFAFDIWGDAVNTAARMEQNSKPGRINISSATYELVKNEFDCEARGTIETKGKGAIEMYFVN